VFASVLAGGVHAQGERPRRQESRENLRQDMQNQLERLRMRERWLTRQLEAMDRGESPEAEGNWREPDRGGGVIQPEERDRLLAVVRDLQADPELAGEPSPFAEALAKEGPERDRVLARIAPRLRTLVELRDSDPERYAATRTETIAGMRIFRAARLLGLAIRDEGSTDVQIEEARQGLRSAIAAGFDARAELMRYELRDAEERLAELRREIAEAESQRDQRIGEQFDRMLRRVEAADGPAPGEGRRPSRDE